MIRMCLSRLSALSVVLTQVSSQVVRECLEGFPEAALFCSDAKCLELYGPQKGYFNESSGYCEPTLIGDLSLLSEQATTSLDSTAKMSEKALSCPGTYIEEYDQCFCDSSQSNCLSDNHAAVLDSRPATSANQVVIPAFKELQEARNT